MTARFFIVAQENTIPLFHYLLIQLVTIQICSINFFLFIYFSPEVLIRIPKDVHFLSTTRCLLYVSGACSVAEIFTVHDKGLFKQGVINSSIFQETDGGKSNTQFCGLQNKHLSFTERKKVCYTGFRCFLFPLFSPFISHMGTH